MFDAMSTWNPNFQQQPSPLLTESFQNQMAMQPPQLAAPLMQLPKGQFGGVQFSADNLQGDWMDPMSPTFGNGQPIAAAMGGPMQYPGAGGGLGDKLREWGVLGTRDQQGWGGLALGAAQGAAGLYMGMKQYGLMKDQLATQKSQFERQYDAQRTTTNARMEDRQRARVNSSTPGAYESVSSYMDRNRVK